MSDMGEELAFECPDCGEIFTSEDALDEHQENQCPAQAAERRTEYESFQNPRRPRPATGPLRRPR